MCVCVCVCVCVCFICWFKIRDGIAILRERAFQVEVTPDEVIITCKKADKQKDDGPLTVALKNEKGSDKATIPIKVEDKPDKPEGPLEVIGGRTGQLQIGVEATEKRRRKSGDELRGRETRTDDR